jgi:hypothetical protein
MAFVRRFSYLLLPKVACPLSSPFPALESKKEVSYFPLREALMHDEGRPARDVCDHGRGDDVRNGVFGLYRSHPISRMVTYRS